MEATEHKKSKFFRTLTQKEADLKFGLEREKPIADLLEIILNKKLKHSLHKMSCFDYYDIEETFLIEIKNYRYSINKYEYEIIGVNKLITDNLLLVFRHEDTDKEIYFIQYNEELFKFFNRRYIGITLCVDIPKHLLIKYNSLSNIEIKINKNEIDFIKNKIDMDKKIAEIYNEIM